MKKLRHYDKNLAVVISVFGSAEEIAMQQYLELLEEIKNNLTNGIELRLAVSSKTVLKKQESNENKYFTLAEQLANLDKLGYKKVIIGSINVFPTEEHESVLNISNAFKKIAPIVNYQITMPLFTKSKYTNSLLIKINTQLRSQYNNANLIFIAHGAPNLNNPGSQTYLYIREYLNYLNKNNFFYSLEGAYSYDKNLVINEIEEKIKNDDENFVIVPLLLVAGNHIINDINEIKSELSEKYKNITIAQDSPNNSTFSLLKLEETKNYFIQQIKDSIKKAEWLS